MERLDNIRKLISRTEQLTNQQRVLKQRHEKQRKEDELKHQVEIEEKNSEIQVLKEMIKSAQMQLKAREKDQVRLKSKLVHLEGKSLAARQRDGQKSEIGISGTTPSLASG